MRYTIKDIKNSLPDYKAKKEPLWGRIFVRRASFYLTYPFINSKWTADGVSLLSCIVALIGSFLMCINHKGAIWAGIIVLNLWSVLDCVDGNMARCRKVSSLGGEFFDAVGGYTISAFSMVGFGMAAYHVSDLFGGKYNIYFLLIGTLGGLCDIFSRLIYQKFSNCMMRMEAERVGLKGIKVENDNFYHDETKNSFLKQLSLKVDYEFGIGGDELLFLILAAALELIDIFVILYSLYHVVGLAIVFMMYTKKMLLYNQTYIGLIQGDNKNGK